MELNNEEENAIFLMYKNLELNFFLKMKEKDESIDVYINALNKKEHSACPVCGHTKPKYKYKVKYGHGDSGYNSHIKCKCGIIIETGENYGEPEKKDVDKAFKKWDRLTNKKRPG